MRIKGIIKKAERNFIASELVDVKNKKGKVVGVAVKPLSKRAEQKRMEHNFYVYASALEKIDKIISK